MDVDGIDLELASQGRAGARESPRGESEPRRILALVHPDDEEVAIAVDCYRWPYLVAGGIGVDLELRA
jgi:hypothetical protein